MAIVAKVQFSRFLEYRFDAECYRPDLQAVEKRVMELKSRPLEALAAVSDGNHISIADYFCPLGVRYLKGAEIAEVFIDDTEPTFIPDQIYGQIPRAHVKPGDVLLSVIGSVGPVALVTNKYERLSCSCKLAILRPHAISGALLTAYLLSPTGQALLLRRNRGSVQQGVVLPDIRTFPVPNFSDALSKKVERAMFEAASEKLKADSLYPEAENDLLERMRWQQLKQYKHELSYFRNFSEMRAASRADAEFFQPQYDRFRSHISNLGAEKISSFCPRPRRGVSPETMEGGEVLVVDSKAVRQNGIDADACGRASSRFYDLPANSKGRVSYGDVLLNSTGRGTLGRAGCYRLKNPAICDNHVAILRPDPAICHPVYLSLFLNSPAGTAQSERFQTGSSGQLEIYPEQIEQFLIFIPRQKSGSVDAAWQGKLVEKVEAAAAAIALARAKLEEAKNLVEASLYR